MRYPITPYDLSKYQFSGTNPVGQMTPINLGNIWNNGMPLINNRSAFPQQLNDYQQVAWPLIAQSNNGFMPPMQF